MDWQQLFVPSVPIAEIFVRGTIVYVVLFVALRLLPRRSIGSMGAADILVIVLISETVSNAMQGEAKTLGDGLLLAAVVLGWATLVDYLDYRLPQWHIAAARPIEIVRDGQLLHKNMAREHITEDEVMSQLREHGFDSPKRVVKAYLEGDGHVSVIVRGQAPLKPAADRHQP